MAAGKTYLGRRIAKALELKTIDLDAVIEDKAGQCIKDLFANKGENYFRNLESECLNETIKSETAPFLLASGGGLVLRPENQKLLRENFLVVFLNPEFEKIFGRLTKSNCRPIVKEMEKEDIYLLWEKRLPIYKELANIEVDCVSNEDLLVAEIVEKINNYDPE